jgi:zinc transporter ZupT
MMIHNIPEGILTRQVMAMAGIPTRIDVGPGRAIGALAALGVLQYSWTNHLPLDNILVCVAGIMCMVAARELYPEAYCNLQTPNDYRSTILGWDTLRNHPHGCDRIVSTRLNIMPQSAQLKPTAN